MCWYVLKTLQRLLIATALKRLNRFSHCFVWVYNFYYEILKLLFAPEGRGARRLYIAGVKIIFSIILQ